MKKRLLTAISVLAVLSLAGCNKQAAVVVDPVEQQIREIYNQAVANGETRTYEEWLASIKGEKGDDGHSPVIAINEDGYWTIDGVSTGVKAQGPKGDPGDPGTPGTPGTPGEDGKPGADGTSVRTGEGKPSDSFGKNGDSYIDTNTWDYYVMENGTWVLKGNIKGEDGKNFEVQDHIVRYYTAYSAATFNKGVIFGAGPLVQYPPMGAEEETWGYSLTVHHGDLAIRPSDPVLTGYNFDGWYAAYSVGGSSTFGYEPFYFTSSGIVQDMSIYAKYSPKAYTYTLMDGDNKIGDYNISYGDALELENLPASSSGVFAGWYTADDKAVTSTYLYDANMTFYAKYRSLPDTAKGSYVDDEETVVATIDATSLTMKADIEGEHTYNLERYEGDTALFTYTSGNQKHTVIVNIINEDEVEYFAYKEFIDGSYTSRYYEYGSSASSNYVRVHSPIHVSRIVINTNEVTSKVGQVVKFEATFNPDNVYSEFKKVTGIYCEPDGQPKVSIKGDNPYFTVDLDKLELTSKQAGVYEISIVCDGVESNQAAITVSEPVSVTSVDHPEDVSVIKGKSRVVEYTYAPVNANEYNFTITSSNESAVTAEIVSVSNGVISVKVNGVKEGGHAVICVTETLSNLESSLSVNTVANKVGSAFVGNYNINCNDVIGEAKLDGEDWTEDYIDYGPGDPSSITVRDGNSVIASIWSDVQFAFIDMSFTLTDVISGEDGTYTYRYVSNDKVYTLDLVATANDVGNINSTVDLTAHIYNADTSIKVLLKDDIQQTFILSLDTSKVKTTFAVNDTFTYAGLTGVANTNIVATSDTFITEDLTVTAPDMTTAGEKTVTVTAVHGLFTATYKINVIGGAPTTIEDGTYTGTFGSDFDIVVTVNGDDVHISVNDLYETDGTITDGVFDDQMGTLFDVTLNPDGSLSFAMTADDGFIFYEMYLNDGEECTYVQFTVSK